ncbi:hypothetical protein KAW38_01095 [Candidatus Micrarchaeota archaeon]|nr:hypothetical protein [Candidatus Micrarchaeota archaeon]
MIVTRTAITNVFGSMRTPPSCSPELIPNIPAEDIGIETLDLFQLIPKKMLRKYLKYMCT